MVPASYRMILIIRTNVASSLVRLLTNPRNFNHKARAVTTTRSRYMSLSGVGGWADVGRLAERVGIY